MEQLLNFALFGSFAWALTFFIVLFIVFMISEGVEHGGIAFLGVVVFLVLNHYWGNIPVMELFKWQNILAYLGIGFVFANIRIYFYGRQLSQNEQREDVLKDNVFRWWFIWPASLIYWAFSDLLGNAWDWIYSVSQSTFKFFLNLGINSNVKKVK